MFKPAATRSVNVLVTIDGLAVAGAVTLELFQTGAFSADRFVLSMAFSGATGAVYYTGLSTALINIAVAFGAGTGSTMIVGQLDNVTIDFSAYMATLSGRDLSARLIDSEVNQSFSNQIASSIAENFALAAGLTPNTIPTRTPIGQYYEMSHTRTALGLHTRNNTQWNLLSALAEIEAYSLYVNGTTLNFVPQLNSAIPVILTYGRDLISLSIDKAVSLVNAKVTVKSWNTRLKVAHFESQGSGLSTTLVKPNLMPDQVSNIAIAKQADLAAQSYFLRAVMPGETSLQPRTWINLQGTDTLLDGLYVVQAIERHINAHQGFTQVVEAYAIS